MVDDDIGLRLRRALQRSVSAEIPSPHLKASVESRIRSSPKPRPGVRLIGWLRSPRVAFRVLALAAAVVVVFASYSALAKEQGQRIVVGDGAKPGGNAPGLVGPLLPRPPDPGIITFSVTSQKDAETGAWVAAPDGFAARRVTPAIPNCSHDVVGARARRDGKAILFAPVDCGLWTVNLDGTGLNSIDANGGCWSGCDWSPDGRKVVYETRASGAAASTTQVVMASADGSAPTQIGMGDAPAWSSDGRTIALNVPAPGPLLGHNVALFDLVSRTTRIVVSKSQPGGIRALTPSFDPTGTRIVVKVNNVGFKIIDIGSATIRGRTIDVGSRTIVRVCPAAGSMDNDPSWSPDGKSIAYTAGADHIAICDLASGGDRTLPKIGDTDQRPSWR